MEVVVLLWREESIVLVVVVVVVEEEERRSPRPLLMVVVVVVAVLLLPFASLSSESEADDGEGGTAVTVTEASRWQSAYLARMKRGAREEVERTKEWRVGEEERAASLVQVVGVRAVGRRGGCEVDHQET